MKSRLSYTIRESPIYEGVKDTIVDFEIDSKSVWRRMLDLEPQLMSNPKGNPDGTFVGVSIHKVIRLAQVYETGSHPTYRDGWRGLAPLLACSDCGWEGCGGIFTRVFIGQRRVFWSGIGFSGGASGFGPIYDSTTFVFDRSEYTKTLGALLESIRVLASERRIEDVEQDDEVP